MSSIIKTRTQGFRVCTFRNQEVHKYYSHLQSVMRSIDTNGAYNELFAKPEIDSMAVGATEIEWTCSGNGKAVHISQLSDSERNRIEKKVSEAFSKIESYISENRDKSGKSRDYAQFLSIVGKRPDSNQIWVVNSKPIIVQWGFSDDNGLMGSSGIYSDWDSFINDIKREPEKPEEPVKIKEPTEEEKSDKTVETVASTATASLFNEPEKKVEEPVEKSVEKPVEDKPEPVKKEENKPTANTEEPKTVMAGLGGYVWVKWLAIVLFIIILILLLLRFLNFPKLPYNQIGGNNGAISGSLGGGNGGGSDGQGGGQGGNQGGGQGGQGGNQGGGQGGQGGGDNGAGSGGQGNGGNNSVGGNPGNNPDDSCPVCSQPFGNHGPEDFKKCIRQASGKNGQQGGAPSGSSVGSKSPCKSCNGKGLDSSTGKPCSSCGGSGEEISSTDNKSENTIDESKLNPEDDCPVCNRKFKLHSSEDLKNCILIAQRDKIEFQKKFEKLKSETNNNKANKIGE